MKIKGPWSRAETQRFLVDARVPLRLAGNGRSGHPVLASLWFVPIEGRLWCATQAGAHVARLLERDPRCAWEVSVESPPYRGVRGAASGAIHDDRGEDVLQRLIDRYGVDRGSDFAAFLLSRVHTEIAICIEPTSTVSWDFTQRMGSAVRA